MKRAIPVSVEVAVAEPRLEVAAGKGALGKGALVEAGEPTPVAADPKVRLTYATVEDDRPEVEWQESDGEWKLQVGYEEVTVYESNGVWCWHTNCIADHVLDEWVKTAQAAKVLALTQYAAYVQEHLHEVETARGWAFYYLRTS